MMELFHWVRNKGTMVQGSILRHKYNEMRCFKSKTGEWAVLIAKLYYIKRNVILGVHFDTYIVGWMPKGFIVFYIQYSIALRTLFF